MGVIPTLIVFTGGTDLFIKYCVIIISVITKDEIHNLLFR